MKRFSAVPSLLLIFVVSCASLPSAAYTGADDGDRRSLGSERTKCRLKCKRKCRDKQRQKEIKCEGKCDEKQQKLQVKEAKAEKKGQKVPASVLQAVKKNCQCQRHFRVFRNDCYRDVCGPKCDNKKYTGSNVIL